jgi:hypothetical protein
MMLAVRSLSMITLAALSVLLGACANNFPSRTLSYKDTPIDRPTAPLSDAELLAVRIETFDPGTLPSDPKTAKGLSLEIRRAEARYIPVQLRNTMQKSGHWGPVRVVPQGTREGEVVVTGTIVESDGELLKLRINVKDAAGVQWFEKDYESVIDEAAYRKAELGGVDPFQDLYNQIANDIAAHKRSLKPNEGSAIRQIAELRFGAEFAPNAYAAYVQRSPEAPAGETGRSFFAFFTSGQNDAARKPLYAIARLPSMDDPIVQRVGRIRAREELLVDTLDQQYDALARDIGGAYTDWRSSRLKEIAAIRESDRVQNKEQAKAVAIGVVGILAGAAIASQSRGGRCYGCTTAGVAVGGIATAVAVQMAMKASEQASAEADLRKSALEELGQSLTTNVGPTVVEVEGKTVELKGTIEEKFAKWRAVLKELQDNETAPRAMPTAVPTT